MLTFKLCQNLTFVFIFWPLIRATFRVCLSYAPHSPARSLKRHSFEASLHHEVKSLVIWDVQSYGASSQEGLPWTEFSLPHRKILRPVNIVFDDICPEWPWIAFFAGDFRKLQPYVCHVSCYLTTCNVIELKGFPNSPEVMLFVQPEYKFTFSCFQNFL